MTNDSLSRPTEMAQGQSTVVCGHVPSEPGGSGSSGCADSAAASGAGVAGPEPEPAAERARNDPDLPGQRMVTAGGEGGTLTDLRERGAVSGDRLTESSPNNIERTYHPPTDTMSYDYDLSSFGRSESLNVYSACSSMLITNDDTEPLEASRYTRTRTCPRTRHAIPDMST
ncbi:unnamed protein product [Danaus chrysippus]|uniref:(African queen) hypothetical protein n=1 Tax=Danaus chrysippus TaxID=151541 RepID=A0A8J2R167_9NEOP|nr:unnamed protein product [Danaus chrysippus]